MAEGADLRTANLCEAFLEGADLSLSDLEGAAILKGDLRFAILRHANLSGADLRGADLTEAVTHRIRDTGTKWEQANRNKIHGTDASLAAAEDWRPPRTVKRTGPPE